MEKQKRETLRIFAIVLWAIIAGLIMIQAFAILFCNHLWLYEEPFAFDINFAVFYNIGYIDTYTFIWVISLSVAYILEALSICFKKQMITFIGLILPPLLFLSLFSDIDRLNFVPLARIIVILRFIASAMLILAINKVRRKGAFLYFVATVPILLCGIYITVKMYALGWQIPFPAYWGIYIFTCLYYILLTVAHTLTGVVSMEFPKCSFSFGERRKARTIRQSATRIAALKKLLDAGTITQDEFDEKKKEILNSSN